MKKIFIFFGIVTIFLATVLAYQSYHQTQSDLIQFGSPLQKNKTVQVNASSSPPSPRINGLSASPTSGTAPLSVVFSYWESAGLTSSESIDFGDGISGRLTGDPSYKCPPTAGCMSPVYQAPHTYKYPGTYVVTLKDKPMSSNGKYVNTVLGTVTITVKPSSHSNR